MYVAPPQLVENRWTFGRNVYGTYVNYRLNIAHGSPRITFYCIAPTVVPIPLRMVRPKRRTRRELFVFESADRYDQRARDVPRKMCTR